MNLILFLLMGAIHVAIGADNTTEPPMINYGSLFPSNDDAFLVNFDDNDDDNSNSDNSTGDPIVIILPGNNTGDDFDASGAMTLYEEDFPGLDEVTDGHNRQVKRLLDGQDRIINGFLARRNGLLPIKARLFPTFGGNRFVCGGTIISSRWVLTAAHCLVGPSRLTAVPIRVGSIDSEAGGQLVSASRAIVHQRYRDLGNRRPYGYDIGLLKTRQRMVLNRNVQPALLAVRNPRLNTFLYAAGWGITETGRISQFLKFARLRVTRCNRFPPGTPSRSSLVCTWDGQDRTCSGDSGGFLGTIRNRRFVVDGITSFGPGNCGANSISAYTSVAFFRGWIINTVRRN